MLLRSLETLNRVFLISQKWDLPGSSTKPFNYLANIKYFLLGRIDNNNNNRFMALCPGLPG